jgi:hypothetical protein
LFILESQGVFFPAILMGHHDFLDAIDGKITSINPCKIFDEWEKQIATELSRTDTSIDTKVQNLFAALIATRLERLNPLSRMLVKRSLRPETFENCEKADRQVLREECLGCITPF